MASDYDNDEHANIKGNTVVFQSWPVHLYKVREVIPFVRVLQLYFTDPDKQITSIRFVSRSSPWQGMSPNSRHYLLGSNRQKISLPSKMDSRVADYARYCRIRL